MVELLKNLSEDEATSYGLVLSSSDISHVVRTSHRGRALWVHDGDYQAAFDTIRQYVEENRDLHLSGDSPSQEYHRTYTGLWVSAVLLACHVALAMGNQSHAIVRVGGSSAAHILSGQLYRAVTSLMLHANALHLAGNIVGIALFGTAVCTSVGWGVGWLMILVTGIVGNLANALLYQADHVSVGASTAVFGAIGILAAQQFFKKFRLTGQKMKAWIPLAGGVALLGILGSGEHADLMAHLFGFAAGIVLGAVYAVFVRRAAARGYQACCLLLAFSLVVTSWMRALGYIG